MRKFLAIFTVMFVFILMGCDNKQDEPSASPEVVNSVNKVFEQVVDQQIEMEVENLSYRQVGLKIFDDFNAGLGHIFRHDGLDELVSVGEVLVKGAFADGHAGTEFLDGYLAEAALEKDAAGVSYDAPTGFFR